MQRVQKFVVTMFIGGLIVILPTVVLLNILFWLVGWVTEVIEPLTGLIVETTRTNRLVAEAAALLSILTSCFMIGLLVQTSLGNWIHRWFENSFLARIPGYRILRDLVSQLGPKQNGGFSRPVLFSWDKQDNFFLAYITDEYGEDRYAIFIPTSPSPVNGFVIQTTLDHLRFLDVSAESMMKVVISCGVNSNQLMEKIESS